MVASPTHDPLVAAVAEGTVTVQLTLSSAPWDVWRALTEPELLGRWFGTLSAPLWPGTRARLDFGDGDFFDLQTLHLDPPYQLQYAWRFLGIGPLDTIAWRIAPLGTGCQVTVADSEPHRSRAAARELREGWLDFTRRLRRFLATGRSARYTWRREFDGSIELVRPIEEASSGLFAAGAPARWLPLDGAALEAGAALVLDDGLEPAHCTISDVAWTPPDGVAVRLLHGGAEQPTRCRLALLPYGPGALLSVNHSGWVGLSRRRQEQMRQRRRFSLLWIAALRRAQQTLR